MPNSIVVPEPVPDPIPLPTSDPIPAPEKDYNLSNLGTSAALASDSVFAFEVLTDIWHPTQNPTGYVNLGVAENALLHHDLAAYIRKNLTFSEPSLTYGAGGMGSVRLRGAIATFLTRHLKAVVPIKGEHVIATNGCSSAIEHCSYLLSDPEDGFLLGQPYYGTFMVDVQTRPKTTVVPVSFGDVDPISVDAVAKYERTIETARSQGIKLRGLILCNPHNPLGRCYPREAIVALMKLCQKHRMHFVSDEIYALSLWENKVDEIPAPMPFISAASIDTTDIIDPHLVHILWGMSKDFGANGLRIGVIVSQSNPEFVKALQMVSLYSYPSSLTDNITATLLEDVAFTDGYIQKNQRALSEAYSRGVNFLKKHNIDYEPGANAAFFIWADLGRVWSESHSLRSEEDIDDILMEALMKEKVYLASGKGFGSEKPGWFRIVFATTPENLTEGLARIVRTIKS